VKQVTSLRGQALPQAVRHDLVVAPGMTVSAAGSFASGNRGADLGSVAVIGLPRRRTAAPGGQQSGTRLVMEATLVAASVAGIVVFRDQGVQAGPGVNLHTSSAPIVVAIPAVIVVLRLYPLVLRGLLRAAARSSRAPAFLGLARASRTAALTPAVPVLALVLALTVAAFAGMVRHAVINGESRPPGQRPARPRRSPPRTPRRASLSPRPPPGWSPPCPA
jgi:hypothetical protein